MGTMDAWSLSKIIIGALKVLISAGAVIYAMCKGRWDDLKSDWDNGCFNPFNQSEDVALKSKVFSFYKGESVVKLEKSKEGLQIFGTIFLGDGITSADTLNHEFGHGIQERFLGLAYLTRIALPSVITYFVKPSDYIYYSMPWERTADWFGGVNRGYYKKGSLVWAFAENILGVGIIPWYFIFGF